MLPDGVLAAMSLPALFYLGTEDPNHANAERAVELMRDARLISLKGLTHVGATFPAPTNDIVLPKLRAFLAREESELDR